MGYRRCPKCGGEIRMDKDTTSGTEYREFYCLKCSWQKEEDRGPALWKVLEDEDELIEKKEVKKNRDE